MFDTVFAGVDVDALALEIERAAGAEARACARRLAAIAELVHRTVEEDDQTARWAVDPWDQTAARVGLALGVSARRASGQMRIAVALRDRLPQVAALHGAGRVSFRLVSEITWRTHLVDDPALLGLIDAALADGVLSWGALSERHLVAQIEAVIERFDPQAVRRSKDLLRTRDLHVGTCEDPAEVVGVWGRLSAADAAVLDRRLSAMAHSVCDADPRSVGERRADALGALGNGSDRLACRCASPDCPASTAPVSGVVVRVIADQAAIDAARRLIAAEDAEQEQLAGTRDAVPAPAPDSTDSGVAILPGTGVLPTAALAEALRGGAQVKPVWLPGPDPEPHYRPSAGLAEFIRARDLVCRHPYCTVPADRCDIDHVIPWPAGPTHPSNLNCACRRHHLMKTFLTADWRDQQSPDATVIWTGPDGRTYTTHPASRLYFPTWDITTTALPPPAANAPPGNHPDLMPRRRRTRAAEEQARVKAERARNTAHLA